MGAKTAFYHSLFKLGSLAGVFSTGTLTGLWVERNGHFDTLLDIFKADETFDDDLVNIDPLDPKISRAQSILKYGIPQSLSPGILYHENHVLEFDPIRKTPIWVAEHITREHVDPKNPTANRKLSKFVSDERIDETVRASNKDFWDSGWSRGHMAPAGNNKHCQQAMNDTFLLSNIVPQDLDNNGDFWNRLEIYCRDLSKKFNDVRITSGPLWLAVEESDQIENENPSKPPKLLLNGRPCKPHKTMTYPVIGKNEISVPTHLYKVIIAEDPLLDMPLLAAFVVPNEPIPKNARLVDFQIPLSDLERKVGFRFHVQLDRNNVSDLCSVDGCSIMRFRDFQAYFIRRGINGARNINELERYWRQANKYDLDSDAEIKKIYNSRLKEMNKTDAVKNHA